MAWPSAWSKWARWAFWPAASRKEKNVYEPSGRYGAVMPIDGLLGTDTMPGVFAQAGMEYANDNDGVGL